ncbi:MAG: glycosyltransferase family 2 protein, partial [Candidatus Paceibacterota bacterium]
VIIPVFNKEEHIKDTIQSVLDQKFDDFELIIVCDPSTDNSTKEVLKFSDSRISVFTRSKSGPGGYAARNLGIEKSAANWICFLDADDEWESNHLKLAHKHIQDVKAPDCIVFSFKEIKNNSFSDKTFFESKTLLTRIDSLKMLSRKDFIHTNSIVIKKNALIEIGKFPDSEKYSHGGDVDTWLRLILNKYKILYIPSATSNYFKGKSDVTTNLSSMCNEHPVNDTIDTFCYQNLSLKEKYYLSVLYNRKLLSVLSFRKMNKKICLKNIFLIRFYALNFTMIFKILAILILPAHSFTQLSGYSIRNNSVFTR